MPFSKTVGSHTEEYWKKHFESFLKPLIEEKRRLEARRSQPLRGNILNQIISDLVTSKVVVADLTDHNPNVYWELGVRQSFKNGTITIAESGTRLPFDIGGKGTLFYFPKDHLKDAGFRRQFKKALRDCLEHPEIPDSVVLESISGRGTLFELFRREETIRRLDAIDLECARNRAVLDQIANRAQMNLKCPEKRTFQATRLVNSAVELLVTNRYLEEDPRFYNLAETCLRWSSTVNDALARWHQAPVPTEEWLQSGAKRINDIFENFSLKVKKSREKLAGLA
jgi:hypothetical protein